MCTQKQGKLTLLYFQAPYNMLKLLKLKKIIAVIKATPFG
jgi:hypothetical protein